MADESDGFIFDSPQVNDDFAQSMSGGQDVNGDGILDVIIGAPQDGQFPEERLDLSDAVGWQSLAPLRIHPAVTLPLAELHPRLGHRCQFVGAQLVQLRDGRPKLGSEREAGWRIELVPHRVDRAPAKPRGHEVSPPAQRAFGQQLRGGDGETAADAAQRRDLACVAREEAGEGAA